MIRLRKVNQLLWKIVHYKPRETFRLVKGRMQEQRPIQVPVQHYAAEQLWLGKSLRVEPGQPEWFVGRLPYRDLHRDSILQCTSFDEARQKARELLLAIDAAAALHGTEAGQQVREDAFN